MNKTLSILIPVYKEAENLIFLLPELISELNKMQISYEILIVDTIKSLDTTQDICAKYKVKYINRYPTNSYGDAIRIGIENLNSDYAILMDGDGSHNPTFIKQLFEKRNSNSIIIASRYIKGGRTQNTLGLYLMSRSLNILYSFVLGIKCADISNSFKLYNTSQLKSLKLKCDNFDIVEEILINISLEQHKLKIIEIPFFFEARKNGKTKRNLFLFIISFALTLFKLKKIQLKTKTLVTK